MTMKKTREEVAYEYLKDCGPCLITYEDNDKVKILLSSSGEIFWLNDESGPYIPYITLSEVLAEAKPLLLTLFTSNMQEDLNSSELYGIEDELRNSLSMLVNKKELSKDEVREIKIKFLDVKEEILDKESSVENGIEVVENIIPEQVEVPEVKPTKAAKSKAEEVVNTPLEVVSDKPEEVEVSPSVESSAEPVTEQATGEVIDEDEDPFKQ